MRKIVVAKGNRCWLVALDDPEPHKWQILRSFPTELEAIKWAADLLKDLADQRAAMI